MDLNLLVTLDTLLAERSVSRAARRLNLSQPALSTRLARLRDLMGDPLLLPTQRGMVPTKVALDLQPRLHAALEAVRQAVTIDPDFDPARARGTLDIAASDYTQTTLLLPLARVLREEAPGLRIAWHGLNLATLADQMERGTIDLAINRPQTAPETLRMRPLCRERYVLIARKHHPSIAGRIDLDLFCALDHVIVSPEHGGFTGPTDTVLEALGLRRHVAISAPNFLVVPDVVAGSDMLALVPSRLVREQHHRLQVLEPPIGVPGFELAMLWHDRTTTHTVQRWVRERFLRIATSL